ALRGRALERLAWLHVAPQVPVTQAFLEHQGLLCISMVTRSPSWTGDAAPAGSSITLRVPPGAHASRHGASPRTTLRTVPPQSRKRTSMAYLIAQVWMPPHGSSHSPSPD